MADSVNFSTLGERIRTVRLDSRLSQKAFSKLCGVSPLTLMRYETGSRGPDARFLIRLSENFDVNANWLLRCEGEVYNSAERFSGNGGSLDAEAVGELFRDFADFLRSRSGPDGQKNDESPLRGRRQATGKPGVLVVSRDQTLRKLVRKVLGVFAREIRDAGSAPEARRRMAHQPFSLVVLDIALGSRQSREILGIIRERDEAGVLLLNSAGGPSLWENGTRPARFELLERRNLDEQALLVSAGRLIGVSVKNSG